MFLKIEDIIYDCTSYEQIGVVHKPRWISLSDYTLWENEDLISFFGYKDQSSIENSDEFVQLFSVDIIGLEKKFMKLFSFKEQCAVQLSAENTNYDNAFLCFIDHHNQISQWCEFKHMHLVNAAIEWCKKNHIRYRI